MTFIYVSILCFILFLEYTLYITKNTCKAHRRSHIYISMLPIGLIGLLFYGLSRGRSLQNISTAIGIPSNLRLSKGNLIATLPITFDNPSPQAVNFSNLYLTLKYGGDKVGNLEYLNPVQIKERARTIVETTMTIPFSAIGQTILQAIITRGKMDNVKVVGTVTCIGLDINIDDAFTFSIPPSLLRLLQVFFPAK